MISVAVEVAGRHTANIFSLLFSPNLIILVRYASIACRALQKLGLNRLKYTYCNDILLSSAYMTRISIFERRPTFTKIF